MGLRKRKCARIICLILTFSMVLANATLVFASETETKSRFTITFKVDVPSDYTTNVVAVLSEKDGDEEYKVALSPQNGYMDVQSVTEGTYKLSYVYDGKLSDYKIENEDTEYSVSEDIMIENKLSAITYIDTGLSSSEESDTFTEKEEVYNKGKELLSAYNTAYRTLKKNNSFSNLTTVYRNSTFEADYLKAIADSKSEKDSWSDFSDDERWSYYYLVIAPWRYTIGDGGTDTKTEYLSKLSGLEDKVIGMDGAEDYVNAVKEIWNWNWTNWESYGTFVNIYDTVADDADYLASEADTESVMAISQKKDNESTTTLKSAFLKIVSSNVLTALFIIIASVITLVVYCKRYRTKK